ncbi:hypothetical protein [Rhizobium phage RHph_X2_26]|nr:hypothetical protein [Rhizobium phage RHph_X2_26]
MPGPVLAFVQRYLDWAGHIVEAVAIAAVVALVLAGFVALLALCGLCAAVPFSWHFYALLGAAFATGHFHGREKRDCEVRLKMHPPHLKAYLFWLWSLDEHTDFWPVVGVFLACVAAVVFLLL